VAGVGAVVPGRGAGLLWRYLSQQVSSVSLLAHSSTDPSAGPGRAGVEQVFPPHVDVLIVNYRTGRLVMELLTKLTDPRLHVYVWDNSGELDARQVPSAVHLVTSPTNVLYASANNQLFEMCDGDFVLLLNPDVEIDSDRVMLLAHELQRRHHAWGVAPLFLNVDGTRQNYYRRLPTTPSMLADRLAILRPFFWTSWRSYQYFDLDCQTEVAIEAPPGACLMLSREYVTTPLFDEAYALFFNDADLARRLNASGKSCYLAPTVAVCHLRGASLNEARAEQHSVVARLYDEAAVVYAGRHLRYARVIKWIIRLRTLLYPIWDRCCEPPRVS
jgi:GT2 family glycosyltransferase